MSNIISNIIKTLFPSSIKDTAIYQPVKGSSDTQSNSDGIYHPQSIVSTPIPTTVVASNLVSISLDTQSRRILGGYSFGQLGSIAIGKYVAGVSGQIRISPDGIVAISKTDGLPSITIDGETGDATFKGTIAAGSVVATTIAANQITGQLVNAQIAHIDFAKITDVEITSAMIDDLDAGKITTGTLSGIKIESTNVTTGQRIVLDTGGYIYFYSSGTTPKGTLRAVSVSGANGLVCVGGDFAIDNTKSFLAKGIDSGDYMRLGCDGSGNTILTLTNQNKFYLQNSAGSTNYFTVSSSGTYIQKLSAGLDCNSFNLTVINELHGDDGWIDLNSGHGNTETHHLDPSSTNVYNCGGGSSRYWHYVNAHGFSTHSMGFYDGGVKDRTTGKVISDVEAIKGMQPHPTIKTEKGVPEIDKRTIPLEALVLAQDNDGKLYERNAEDVPIVPMDDGTMQPNSAADGEDIVQLLGITMGAIKELSTRIDTLETTIDKLKK